MTARIVIDVVAVALVCFGLWLCGVTMTSWRPYVGAFLIVWAIRMVCRAVLDE